MLRALLVAIAVLVLPLELAFAETPRDADHNAALKYWQAFATLPHFSEAEQKTLHTQCASLPLDAEAGEKVKKAAYSLRMLHRGAALPRCDWDMGDEEGIFALAPHGQAARVLCGLACVRARMRFEQNKIAEALDDILDALTLSRHITQDGSIVLLHAGNMIEQHLIDTLALYLPQLDAKTLKTLKTRLESLPRGGNLATTLKVEERLLLDWLVRQVKQARDKESLLDFAARLEDSRDKGRAFLQKCGGSAEGVLAFAEQTRGCYERMTKKLDLPLEEFLKESQREWKQQAGNPVFQAIFPALDMVRWRQTRVEVRRALLLAALAVQLDGRDALKLHSDPATGKPFEYTAFEGGFVLRSKYKLEEKVRLSLKLDDKPWLLIVGRRGK
jgi:hypothetical protein